MGGGGGCAEVLQKPIPLRQPFHSVSSRSLRSLSVAGKASKNLRTAATLFGLGVSVAILSHLSTLRTNSVFHKDVPGIVKSLDRR